jgi:hypothetical protein
MTILRQLLVQAGLHYVSRHGVSQVREAALHAQQPRSHAGAAGEQIPR